MLLNIPVISFRLVNDLTFYLCLFHGLSFHRYSFGENLFTKAIYVRKLKVHGIERLMNY